MLAQTVQVQSNCCATFSAVVLSTDWMMLLSARHTVGNPLRTCVSSSGGASGAELALAYSSASAMLPALPASALPDEVRAAQLIEKEVNTVQTTHLRWLAAQSTRGCTLVI